MALPGLKAMLGLTPRSGRQSGRGQAGRERQETNDTSLIELISLR
jgi:hypothetical protein